MRNKSLGAAGLGAAMLLVLSGCSGSAAATESSELEPSAEAPQTVTDDDMVPATLAEGVVVPEGVDVSTIYQSPGAPPLTQEYINSLDPARELTVECTDPEALAANEGHEPAGWPQDWDGQGPMPDPECHPDFIEVYAWDRFDEFHSCWEGNETSTAVRSDWMTDDDANRVLWSQSRARANWEWPEGQGAPNNSPECLESYEKNSS